MLERLTRRPAGEQVLAAAVQATVRNLQRASAEQAGLRSADPARGDEFYLMSHPGGLEAALIRLIGADQDYRDTQFRRARAG